MDFQNRKQQALASLDKSRKGSVDAPIVELINKINTISSYFTTSSCSGRISILQELSNDNTKKKKKAGEWIFVSHEPADAEHVADLLFSQTLEKDKGLVVLRFEPFILAVDCSDIVAAQRLVASAISCGFRESGITSIGKRIMVALRCSIRMEVPVADKGQMLVSRDYIRFLVNLANSKMEVNKKRIDRLFENFQEQAGDSPSMKNNSCQWQGNIIEQVKGDHRTGGRRPLEQRCSAKPLRERISFIELESRQLNILSIISKLEEFVASYDNNCTGLSATNCQSNCHNEKANSCKVFSSNDGGNHSTCNSSSPCQPQNYNSGFCNCRIQASISQDKSTGLGTSPVCSLNSIKMKIVGERLEKLFRWGHSTCVANFISPKSLLIFGGYGGLGRHSRQNDTLVLDAESGYLKTQDVRDPPSPRMGHTASLVGQCMFIIGGREDPTKILSDVWFLDIAEFKWHMLEFCCEVLPARHRHASAVVGSCIYVFGGVSDATIYGDMHVLDTDILQWKRVEAKGELPCARHSHSLAVRGTKIYLYGGYDGNRILGDLHSYDVETDIWNVVEATGRTPGPKFSHSLVVFNKFLAVIGGCPLANQFQQFVFLDLELLIWRHVSITSIGGSFVVRSAANVVGEELIITGGGSSCYAFGTMFNEPFKINVHPLIFSDQQHQLHQHVTDKTTQDVQNCQTNVTNKSYSAVHYTGIGKRTIPETDKPFFVSKNVNASENKQNLNDEKLCEKLISPRKKPLLLSRIANTMDKSDEMQNEGESPHCYSFWILRIDKISGKLVKDVLKKLGWLDKSRKAKVTEQGSHICFPITEEAAFFFQKNSSNFGEKTEDLSSMNAGYSSELKLGKGVSKNDVSVVPLLNVLISCHGTIGKEDICSRNKEFKGPQELLQQAISSLTKQKGLSASILKELPSRWERLGDMAVLPMNSFRDNSWTCFGTELWATVARVLGVRRVARQGRIAATGTRDSTLELLIGDNGWVEHRENGMQYCFDATKCMFSSGNISEKLRMAKLDCRNEIVVDLFAGIGYFVLPLLVKAGAKLVYACEWNPSALSALRHNVFVNGVEDRCIILEGDNRITAPVGIAHRVCLGLLPSSELSWRTAVRALRPEGGVLHVHDNVKENEEVSWLENLSLSLRDFALAEGYSWKMIIEHVERVKWYAPHIRHLVADVRCINM